MALEQENQQEISIDQNNEIIKFREILSNPDLAFYVQARLNEGDGLLGETRNNHGGGYVQAFINRTKISDFFPDRPTASKQDLYSRSYTLFERLGLQSKDKQNSLKVLILNNLGEMGLSGIGFQYNTTRADTSGRVGPASIFTFLPADQAAKVLEILKKGNLDRLITTLQDRISPDLKAISPSGKITELDYGQLVLDQGEDWQRISSKEILVDTIIDKDQV